MCGMSGVCIVLCMYFYVGDVCVCSCGGCKSGVCVCLCVSISVCGVYACVCMYVCVYMCGVVLCV